MSPDPRRGLSAAAAEELGERLLGRLPTLKGREAARALLASLWHFDDWDEFIAHLQAAPGNRQRRLEAPIDILPALLRLSHGDRTPIVLLPTLPGDIQGERCVARMPDGKLAAVDYVELMRQSWGGRIEDLPELAQALRLEGWRLRWMRLITAPFHEQRRRRPFIELATLSGDHGALPEEERERSDADGGGA